MLTRTHRCGAFAVALVVLLISTGGAAHAETVPSPEAPVDVIDQPALPAGPVPPIVPSVPEGSFDPAPTGPVPTEVPTTVPVAPMGTSFESTRPSGTTVEYFRSGNGTTTSGSTDGEEAQDFATSPEGVDSEEASAEVATPPPVVTAPPTPDIATASPTPDDVREEPVDSERAVPSVAAQSSPSPAVPSLIVGIMVLAAGVAIMACRSRISTATARAQKRWFATGFGERAPRLRSPFTVGVAGASAALVGVVIIGYALWWFSKVSS